MSNQYHQGNFFTNASQDLSFVGRQLPANIDAEKAILGAILLNDQTISHVVELVAPEDFYIPAHAILYKTIVDLAQQGKRIDIITLQDELIKKNVLDAVGGVVFLLTLQEDIPSLGLLEQHAQIVKEKSTLRQLIQSATAIIASCYAQKNEAIDSVLDLAEKKIFEISHKRTNQHFIQLDIWLKKTFQHLSNLKGHGKGITGTPAGFAKLDEMSSGFQDGDLIILAARPSMGKTAFALNIACNVAAQFPVGFFSLEMSAEQLVLRLLASESGISHHAIRNASITSDEWVEIISVAARLSQMKFFIDDTATLTISELRTKARKLKAEHQIKLLVIDYLQLLNSHRIHENRHQEVSEISRSLKALAKELGVPIIALSQLSRAVESRLDKRPMLSDLRESGAIEQDADLIMFLYRDVVYNQETENPSAAEVIIGKQRNGPTGTISLQFVRELTKFVDL